MNENEKPNLTTRRARRMQEQLETTGIPVITPEIAEEAATAATSDSAGAPDGIEISPVDADGRPRTRREMRELREAAAKSRDTMGAPAAPAVGAKDDAEDDADDDAKPEVEASAELELEPEPEVENAVEAEAEVEIAVETEVETEVEVEPEADIELVVKEESDPAAITTEAFIIEDFLAARAGEEDDPEDDSPVEAAEAFVVPSPDFDARLAETEALSLADLDIDSSGAKGAASEDESVDEAEAESESEDESEDEDEAEAEADDEAEAEKPKGRFRLPWGRAKDVADDDHPAEPAENSTEEDSDETVQDLLEDLELVPADESSVVGDSSAEKESAATHAGPVMWTPDLDEDGGSAAPAALKVDGDEGLNPASDTAEVPSSPVTANEDEDEDEDGEVVEAPVPTSARTTYSFPDIVPLDEERSVFDDPSTQAMTALPTQDLVTPQVERTGDFDDLISRAVAAEGATSANTAALILPSMPDGADLTGPLGETGELFVTGSIELPRSLGETGGHARLHESVDFDPLSDLGVDLSNEPVPDDSAPISATRAISARNVQGSGVITPHTQKGNRLPVILSISAGGLLLAFIGLLAWGASNGMFQ